MMAVRPAPAPLTTSRHRRTSHQCMVWVRLPPCRPDFLLRRWQLALTPANRWYRRCQWPWPVVGPGRWTAHWLGIPPRRRSPALLPHTRHSRPRASGPGNGWGAGSIGEVRWTLVQIGLKPLKLVFSAAAAIPPASSRCNSARGGRVAPGYPSPTAVTLYPATHHGRPASLGPPVVAWQEANLGHGQARGRGLGHFMPISPTTATPLARSLFRRRCLL